MPTSLQGLNLVYPAPPPSDSAGQDNLTPPPGFPDLSAQLDLWTNLSFASDEPFIPQDRRPSDIIAGLDRSFRDPGDAEDPLENTNPTLIADPGKPLQTAIDNSTLMPPDQVSFDLTTFLAGFGIDPFLVPPQSSHPPLLSPATPSASSHASPNDISTSPSTGLDSDFQHPSKRTRTRRGSTASQAPAITPSVLQQPALGSDARAEFSDEHDPLTTPLTASEDKRRRNTAASARFRAKKKEREQALEKRSKELETKVAELERECEGLRRENGWLKGLVVGVTGSNPSGVPSGPTDGGGSADTGESNRGKRKRGPESNNGLLES